MQRQLGKAEELGSSSFCPFFPCRTLLVIGPKPLSLLPAWGPPSTSPASMPATPWTIAILVPFSSLNWPSLFLSQGLCTCCDCCLECASRFTWMAPSSSLGTKLKSHIVTAACPDLPIQRSPSSPGPSAVVLLMSCSLRVRPFSFVCYCYLQCLARNKCSDSCSPVE